MAEESPTIRKIYVLPRELVERIIGFQQDKKLPSEVEAVRRLLDEALKYRDTPELIVDRFKDRLKSDGIPSSVAKDVLLGHPLVKSISQEDLESVSFTMRDGRTFSVLSDGTALELDVNGSYSGWSDFPPKPLAITKKSDYNDEIPF